MANFIGATTSSELEIDAAQKAALDEILKKYHFTMEDVCVHNELGSFYICGYDWLNIVADKDGEPEPEYEDVTEVFCEELQKILKPGQEFKIACVGNEKLRYCQGMQIVVTPEKVDWTHIGA